MPPKQPFVGGWSDETGLMQVSRERRQEGAGQDGVTQREAVSVQAFNPSTRRDGDRRQPKETRWPQAVLFHYRGTGAAMDL